MLREKRKSENKNKEKRKCSTFAPDKIEDEKRILDFTGFFGPGDMSENITLMG